MSVFFTTLTDAGAAALTYAHANNMPVSWTQMAVGDGGGSEVTPLHSMTALVSEKYRAAITNIYVDKANANWLVIETTLPSSVGGWTVREIGLYDNSGVLIAVGNFPDTYKPLGAGGISRTMLIRMVIQTSYASEVTLVIDPNLVFLTANSHLHPWRYFFGQM